ncbi:4-coumaroyl-homoserine lactone synthase [Methylobacterium crusticola]|uniref:Acyl-homoserine-lactone synthase n=1 Tax=Methylobacterium crusticola TaxID=1697972 RepID=A0ABQ4QZW4_9HYPH|nr:acyl-homoserine-lactone synthase [Methylobacterium crusticola]GJD50714.1 4-coumaroyl-homoserine lactone synthase [Methylobacterium crusticola]
MIRLHVIDRTNRDAYAEALDQHHVLRRKIYVDDQKWRALRAVDGREHDQFDTDATVYLLAIDADGQVAGGTRLLPSWGPTLLSDVFPHLAEMRGFERGPDIWEWTRFFVAPRHREDKRLSRVAGIVAAGMIEHCLEQGIPRLNAVGEAYWIPKVAELGWRPRPLGLPLAHDGMSICAFTIEMTEAALSRTRAVYGIEGRSLDVSRPRAPAHDRAGRDRGLAAR